MTLKSLRIALFLILNFLKNSYSQSLELKVGNEMPDVTINALHLKDTTVKASITLKHKPTIIYFWSTYCKGCIESIKKISVMDKKYGGKVQFIIVTPEEKMKVVSFWKRNKILSNLDLPAIVEDTILSKYFPHEGVPHIIWINQNSIVKAITNSQYLTETNITHLLSKDTIDWTLNRINNKYNYNTQLLQAIDNGAGKPKVCYYSTVTNYLKYVLSSHDNIINQREGFKRVYYINQPILSLYNLSVKAENVVQIVLNVLDSSRFIFDHRNEYYDKWLWDNAFCYEAILPLSTPEKAISHGMRLDLDRFFGLSSSVETRMVKSLVIKKTSKNVNINNDVEKGEVYRRVSDLAESIKYNIKQPVIDESNINKEINIKLFNVDWTNITSINKNLKRYGLKIVEKNREINVLLIKDYINSRQIDLSKRVDHSPL